MSDPLTRRTALATAGLAVGIPVLASCGGGGDPGADSGTGTDTIDGGSATAAATESSSAASTETSTGTELGSASDIPTGGGKIYADANVVVTQPVAGTFKGFNATCSHRGCQVASITGGAIVCPCHGSKFSIEDGSVLQGPATKGLDSEDVTSDGTSVFLS